jgi:GxxExxY protein
MHELLLKNEVYAIVGAAMEVYNKLGSGFLEPVYQEAMEIEADLRRIPYSAQQPISLQYKGRALKKFYVTDLTCFGTVVVEIKALNHLSLREESRLLNYLKASAMQVGVLINFGSYPNLEWKRMVLTKSRQSGRSVTNPADHIRED